MNGGAYRDERGDLDPQGGPSGRGPQGEWDEQAAPSDPNETQAPAPVPARLPLPPATKWLLIAVGIVFLFEYLPVPFDVMRLGALTNLDVAAGQYWRLLTSMFIHDGIPHILFDGLALYWLGQDVEMFYGTRRFLIIYFLSGLFGSVLWYLVGPAESGAVGSSGAIFGLFGAEIVFFLRNRELFGKSGRQRLINMAVVLVFNLVITFSAPTIAWEGHVGGLVAGALLGVALAPTYAWAWHGFERRLVNRTPLSRQRTVVLLAVILLLAGIFAGNQRWSRAVSDLPGSSAVTQTSGPGV